MKSSFDAHSFFSTSFRVSNQVSRGFLYFVPIFTTLDLLLLFDYNSYAGGVSMQWWKILAAITIYVGMTSLTVMRHCYHTSYIRQLLLSSGLLWLDLLLTPQTYEYYILVLFQLIVWRNTRDWFCAKFGEIVWLPDNSGEDRVTWTVRCLLVY